MLVAWNYRYRNSLIDRIDPRARLIFSFAVLIAATSTWNSLLLAIIFMISIWYSSVLFKKPSFFGTQLQNFPGRIPNADG